MLIRNISENIYLRFDYGFICISVEFHCLCAKKEHNIWYFGLYAENY